MRLLTFTHNGATRVGALRDDGVIDLNAVNSDIPIDMVSLLQGGDAMMDLVGGAVESAAETLPLDAVKLESPVMNPPKILAVGLNFMAHWNEIPDAIKEARAMKLPEKPFIFNKQSTSATGPYDPIALPAESPELDYEAELGVIIGKTCRRVKKENYLDVIAGYTCLNDVTVREWQRHSPTFTMGKSWDTHCPMGPVMVTRDEIDDPHALNVRLTVDGEEHQNFITGDMIFNIAEQIEYLSTAFTLQPGDVIATGTSAGVILFRPGKPWLTEGQKVRVEVEGIGFIENTVEKDAGESYVR
ncbi:MAG: fumarylacetoacetate hydrolase family protein [Pseudomonadota bacterium]